MTYSDIEAYLAVVEEGSFAKAAKKLYISQSTLSWRISELEKECGALLFLRGKGIRNTVLSAEGKKLLPYAAKWRDVWQELKVTVNDLSKNSMSISAIDSICEFVFPHIYEKFQVTHPNTELMMLSNTPEDIYELVANGDVDAGLVATERKINSIKTMLICSESLAIFRGKDCHCPDVVDIGDMDVKKMIPWLFSYELESWLEQIAFPQRSRKIRINNAGAMAALVAHGDSWSIAPATIVKGLIARYPNTHMSTIASGGPRRNIYLVTRKGTELSAEMHSLVSLMRSHIIEVDESNISYK